MTDLTVELKPEDLTADELERRYLAEVADLREHRDPERTALKLAALVQAAVHRLRMGESHGGAARTGSDRGGRDPDRGRTEPVLGPRRKPGGGWVAAGAPKTSLRPH